MSTREIAYGIFNQLNENQLEGFIQMFGEFFPNTSSNKKLDSMIEEVHKNDYDNQMQHNGGA